MMRSQCLRVFGKRHIQISTQRSKHKSPPGITVITTVTQAKQVLDKLMTLTHVEHGCDTEVANIDVKNQSPVGNGDVICCSIYCGEEVDFGSGSMLWIDNFEESKG